MKSGMIAAEILAEALKGGRGSDELTEYKDAFDKSWIHEELHAQRNFGPAQHKFGNFIGSAFASWTSTCSTANCRSPCVTPPRITLR